MPKDVKFDLNESIPVLEDEDKSTLDAIDRGIRSADDGRVVTIEKVRQTMKAWLAKSSSPKTR